MKFIEEILEAHLLDLALDCSYFCPLITLSPDIIQNDNGNNNAMFIPETDTAKQGNSQTPERKSEPGIMFINASDSDSCEKNSWCLVRMKQGCKGSQVHLSVLNLSKLAFSSHSGEECTVVVTLCVVIIAHILYSMHCTFIYLIFFPSVIFFINCCTL